MVCVETPNISAKAPTLTPPRSVTICWIKSLRLIFFDAISTPLAVMILSIKSHKTTKNFMAELK
jgi:hypothetical protein